MQGAVTHPRTGEPLGVYHIVNLLNPETTLIKPVVTTNDKSYYSRIHTFARSKSMDFRSSKRGGNGSSVKKSKPNPWVHDKYEELFRPKQAHSEHKEQYRDNKHCEGPHATGRTKLAGCYNQSEHGYRHRVEHARAFQRYLLAALPSTGVSIRPTSTGRIMTGISTAGACRSFPEEVMRELPSTIKRRRDDIKDEHRHHRRSS